MQSENFFYVFLEVKKNKLCIEVSNYIIHIIHMCVFLYIYIYRINKGEKEKNKCTISRVNYGSKTYFLPHGS